MKNTIYIFIMLLLVAGATDVSRAQINEVKKCKTCGDAIAACPYKGKHPKPKSDSMSKVKKSQNDENKAKSRHNVKSCKSCGKTVDKCPYKGKHPANCETCGKTVDKCAYNGKHPVVPSGYDVIINCNVGSDATLYIDGTDYGKLKNPLNCSFADMTEYDKEAQSISNGIKVEKVFDGVFKTAGIRDGYIITDINNTLVDSRFDVMDIYDQIISNNDEKIMYITGLYRTGNKVYYVVDLDSKILQSSYYIKTGEHNVKLVAEGYEDFFSTISVDQNNHHFYFKMIRKSAEELFLKGMRYKEKNDYESAIECFREAANQGHAEAQNWLGECYWSGRGVKMDHSEAVRWFYKAAVQGLAAAQHNMGWCYEHGDGVEQNSSEAVNWYHKAADQGYAWAQCCLGNCYEKGIGVPISRTEAIRWYSLAADQGDKSAKAALELMGAIDHTIRITRSDLNKKTK